MLIMPSCPRRAAPKAGQRSSSRAQGVGDSPALRETPSSAPPQGSKGLKAPPIRPDQLVLYIIYGHQQFCAMRMFLHILGLLPHHTHGAKCHQTRVHMHASQMTQALCITAQIKFVYAIAALAGQTEAPARSTRPAPTSHAGVADAAKSLPDR